MKVCRDCQILKPLTEFNVHKGCALGVRPECKVCVKAWKVQNYQANKDRIIQNTSNWAKANRDKRRDISKRYYYKNIETERARGLLYAKNNPGIKKAQCARRRASILKATPNWLTETQYIEIVNIYKNCPKGYEVDHIVPLKGKNVSGLHVPWNMQYLTKSENRSKSNK